MIEDLETFRQAVDGFLAETFVVEVDPEADALIRESLDGSGMVLIGEVHGVAENPLVISSLAERFGVGMVALEWPVELTEPLNRFIATGTISDDPMWWLVDGRVTVGHLPVLRRLATSGVQVVLFDATFEEGTQSWSERDAVMAKRLLSVEPGTGGMMVVAGNVHTQLQETKYGLSLGANIARVRPAVRSIWIDYRSGGYNNFGDKHLPDRREGLTQARLGVHYGRELGLQMPVATAALVPGNDDRGQSWSSSTER